MKKTFLFVALMLGVFSPAVVHGHCEIPCGIYGDRQRVDLIREHITTIEKSMNMINQLSKESPINYNQLVRWVDNKEDHATKIQEIVYQYFMNQRIIPPEGTDQDVQKKYMHELQVLHQLAIEAMEAKQSTDLEHIKQMQELTDSFSASYFGVKEHGHDHPLPGEVSHR